MPIKSEYNREKLDALLREQQGVVARGQALDCGLTSSAIGHRLRSDGPWRRLLPGVYVTTTGTATTAQRAIAALLHAGPESVVTGAAAVRFHKLRCAGLNEIDVLVPVKARVHSTGFARITRTTRMPKSVYKAGRLRYAAPARAVADAARGMTRLSDVRALVAEAVQHRHCHLEDLIVELRNGPVVRSHWFRVALREIGDGIRSAAEADLKHLIDGSDLEKPVYNVALYADDGTFLGIADAWWQRATVVGEVDSRQYHLSPEDYERTTMRRNRMEACGIRVMNFLPSSISSDGATIIRDLRGAIENGNRNPPLRIRSLPVGTRLPDGAFARASRHPAKEASLA